MLDPPSRLPYLRDGLSHLSRFDRLIVINNCLRKNGVSHSVETIFTHHRHHWTDNVVRICYGLWYALLVLIHIRIRSSIHLLARVCIPYSLYTFNMRSTQKQPTGVILDTIFRRGVLAQTLRILLLDNTMNRRLLSLWIM